jgi:hypothetical protein
MKENNINKYIAMKIEYLDKIEKLGKKEMFKIRGGAEKPTIEEDIIIIRKRKLF